MIIINHNPQVDIPQCIPISPSKGAKQPGSVNMWTAFKQHRDGSKELLPFFEIMVE